MIWEEVKTSYPDPATFIPIVSDVVIAWCDALAVWLDSDKNEPSVERLLDSLTRDTRLRLFLEVKKPPIIFFIKADGIPGFIDLTCQNSVGFKAQRIRD